MLFKTAVGAASDTSLLTVFLWTSEVPSPSAGHSLPRTAGSAVEASTQDERLARALHRSKWQHHTADSEAEADKEPGWTLQAITVGKCLELHKLDVVQMFLSYLIRLLDWTGAILSKLQQHLLPKPEHCGIIACHLAHPTTQPVTSDVQTETHEQEFGFVESQGDVGWRLKSDAVPVCL